MRKLLLGAGLAIVLSVAPGAQDPPKPEIKYKGVASCKMCHNKKEEGDAFACWEKSKHAKAFETLASDAGKKLAAEKKIDDPQKSKECISCHVTAFGVEEKLLDKKFTPGNVQCEACHGPGELHIKNRIKEASQKKEYARGALKDEIQLANETTCKNCHNEKAPNYKEFKYEDRLKEISHRNPKKKDP